MGREGVAELGGYDAARVAVGQCHAEDALPFLRASGQVLDSIRDHDCGTHRDRNVWLIARSGEAGPRPARAVLIRRAWRHRPPSRAT